MNRNLVEDTHALLHSTPGSATRPTRRLALQTALGLGYAAAAAPLMAQTAIKTSGAVPTILGWLWCSLTQKRS